MRGDRRGWPPPAVGLRVGGARPPVRAGGGGLDRGAADRRDLHGGGRHRRAAGRRFRLQWPRETELYLTVATCVAALALAGVIAALTINDVIQQTQIVPAGVTCR
ncbi:hypothetical protein GCM10018954_084580 [Kutzneria kofuensis]